MSTTKRLKQLGTPKKVPAVGHVVVRISKADSKSILKPTAAQKSADLSRALRQEIADFEAAGCIPLLAGVCLAHGAVPLHASSGAKPKLSAAVERTYRTARLKFVGKTEAERAAQATSTDGELLVNPFDLFSWLKFEYGKKLNSEIENWLAAKVGPRTPPMATATVPGHVTSKRRSHQGHIENHLKTARQLLALFVLMHHREVAMGEDPNWDFLPRELQKRKPPIPGFNTKDVISIRQMKLHIARSIQTLLAGHPLAEKYPAMMKIADELA